MPCFMTVLQILLASHCMPVPMRAAPITAMQPCSNQLVRWRLVLAANNLSIKHCCTMTPVKFASSIIVQLTEDCDARNHWREHAAHSTRRHERDGDSGEAGDHDHAHQPALYKSTPCNTLHKPVMRRIILTASAGRASSFNCADERSCSTASQHVCILMQQHSAAAHICSLPAVAVSLQAGKQASTP